MTGQRVLAIGDLPHDPLDAATAFYQVYLAEAQKALCDADALLIVLPLADFTHSEWRRAVTRSLARENTPKRINMIAADDPDTIAAMTEYCACAPGVTGQYLPAHRAGQYV